MPGSHSCGASTAIVGMLFVAPVVSSPSPSAPTGCAVRMWSMATHAPALTAIRAASAEPGRADSSSAAVALTLRLRSARACSMNGSSSGPRPARRESRNISRSSARSVAHVVASRSRAAAGSRERSVESRATRSANRPSCQSCWILSSSSKRGRAAPPPGVARRANRQSGFSRASHRARGPANSSAAGRRSVRPRAASSNAGSACGGGANPRAFATASHCGSSSVRSGAVPRRPPPDGPGRSASSIASLRAAAGGRAGRGSSGAGCGRSAARAGRRPARRRTVSTAAASSRAAGASGPGAVPGGVRRSVPSSAVVTSPSQTSAPGASTGAEDLVMNFLSAGRPVVEGSPSPVVP